MTSREARYAAAKAKHSGAFQLGIPPYTFECYKCRMVWDPMPVTQGPTKGQVTESSLDKSFQEHLKVCGKG